MCVRETPAEEKTPDVRLTEEAEFPEGPRISMDFENASLDDVLKVFSQQSGLNFVASQEVADKKITLYLDNVTVQDALDNIIRANELRYEREKGSGIFVVFPAKITGREITTMVFPLKYTRVSTSALDVGGKSVIRDLSVRNESLALSTTTQTGGGTGGYGYTGFGAGVTGIEEEEGKARGIDEIVQQLLSPEGKLTLDVRTNSLIVTDYPQNLQAIKEVLGILDVPNRQVMIEVHILEVKATLVKDIGMDWGGSSGSLFKFTGGSRSAAFPFQEDLFQAWHAATQSKSSVTLGTLDAATFTATLRLITRDTDTRVLARPRLLTLNNEAAIIKLVTSTSIAKVSTQSASEGVSVTTSNTAERADTGIVLKLTPQINEDNSIELFVEPSITTVATSTFFSSDFLDPTTRSIRTTVRVKDGETLVLGGLIDQDKTVTYKKIPLLGDIPLLGWAFTYLDQDDVDRELLIFMTPYIVEPIPAQDVNLMPQSRNTKMNELMQASELKKSLKLAEMERTLESLRQGKKR